MDLSRLDQLGNMISELADRSAEQTKDKSKIDDKSELNIFTTGWNAIQSKAKAEGADDMDMGTLETRMKGELSSMLGADFGSEMGIRQYENEEGEKVFSDDEISLESMMSLLSDEDDIDMDKLKEYSKKPMLSQMDSVDKLSQAGFSPELTEVLLEETPGVVRYLTDAIGNGTPERSKKQIDKTTALLDAGFTDIMIEAFEYMLEMRV